jgi:hypothetical protein
MTSTTWPARGFLLANSGRRSTSLRGFGLPAGVLSARGAGAIESSVPPAPVPPAGAAAGAGAAGTGQLVPGPSRRPGQACPGRWLSPVRRAGGCLGSLTCGAGDGLLLGRAVDVHRTVGRVAAGDPVVGGALVAGDRGGPTPGLAGGRAGPRPSAGLGRPWHVSLADGTLQDVRAAHGHGHLVGVEHEPAAGLVPGSRCVRRRAAVLLVPDPAALRSVPPADQADVATEHEVIGRDL